MATNALDVGRELVELCRAGKHLEAVDALYGNNVVSIEVRGDANMPARMEGIDAIRGKNKWWLENHEVHGGDVKGPFPHGDRFIVFMNIDVTPKTGPFAGKRMQFQEEALYTVRDGKIVQEEFFYDMGDGGGQS
jgi:ketosteroid isomerase-like protein